MTYIFCYFQFQNKGPSHVDTSKAVIKIPEQIGSNYFLNIFYISVSINVVLCNKNALPISKSDFRSNSPKVILYFLDFVDYST